MQFRGINLGGDSKMPTKPCGFTWNRDLNAFFGRQAFVLNFLTYGISHL
jgi:hypothetical protein